MSRKIWIVTFLAVLLTVSASYAQDSPANQDSPDKFPKPEFITEDGNIDLSKLPEKMPEPMKENFKKADANNDGIVDQDEMKTLKPVFGPRPGGPAFGAPFNGPAFGPRPGGPRNRPGAEPGNFPKPEFITEDGNIDLSKLPEKMPEPMKENFKKADANNDGIVDQDEMKTLKPAFGAPFNGPAFGPRPGTPGKNRPRVDKAGKKRPVSGPRPEGAPSQGKHRGGIEYKLFETMKADIMTEDGKVDIARLVEKIPAFDTNNDGFIDRNEIKAALEKK